MERSIFFRAGIGALCVSASLTAQVAPRARALDYRPARSIAAVLIERPPSFALHLIPVSPKLLGGLRPEESASLRAKSQSRVVGVQRYIAPGFARQGAWRQTGNGRDIYQLAIASEGAAGLRVHFSNFAAGSGRVWIYSADRAEVRGPYTGSGIDATGDFWSNTIHADTVVIEYAPERGGKDVPFDISAIGHAMSVDPGITSVTESCELDVSCYADWSGIANGVGMINFMSGGQMNQCTGSLVNNAKNDFAPYFLTAGHCVPDAATAQSVEVVWQYQTGSCNGAHPDPKTLPSTLGAQYLVGATVNPQGVGLSDYSLLRLNSLPNMNLVFYGWNPDPNAIDVGSAVTAIHHPDGEVKRIAFGSRAPDVRDPSWPSLILSNAVASFYEVQFSGMAAGRVEPGSSGSPLLAGDRTIVGTLSAVPYPIEYSGQACTYDPYVVQYSRFSNAYALLAPYLGAPTLTSTSTAVQPPAPNSSNSIGAVSLTASPTSLSWYWAQANPSQTAPAFITLTTASSLPVTVQISATDPWIAISDEALAISQSNPGLLRASLDPRGILTGGNLTGAITVTAGGVQTSIPVTLNAVVTGLKPSLDAHLSVFPLVQAGPGFTSTFTLTNSYSSPTTGFLEFNNPDGSPLLVQTAPAISSADPADGFPSPFVEANLSANQSVVITTAPVTPLRQGMALAWTDDPKKQLQATLFINGGKIPAALPVALPFAMPFDATQPGSTQLFVYNQAWYGNANLTVTGYDSAGSLIGAVSLSVPVQQGGSLVLSPANSLFGGKKGSLVVSGSGTVVAMGLQIGASGGITPVLPSPLSH